MKRRRFFQIIPLLLAAFGLKSAKVKIPVTKVNRNDIIGTYIQDKDGKEWMIKSICPQGYDFKGQLIYNWYQDKFLATNGKEVTVLCIRFDGDKCVLPIETLYSYG